MKKLTELAAWQALQQHYQTIRDGSMQDWFANDAKRFTHFSLTLNDMLWDFSKNRINQDTLSLFVKLAEDVKLSEARDALFSGSFINFTEQRPALHTALRDRNCHTLRVNGINVMADIQSQLKKMHVFTEEVRQKKWRGATGKPIRDIVNIGIGGSHLGPLMVTQALKEDADPALHCYFISNIDGSLLHDVLEKIDPERTLFIISSKTFTTIETLSNAKVIQAWLQEKLGTKNVSPHFVAVTSALEKAKQWGIPETQIFSIWDWVGGRYSVWSAMGLSIALMIGMEKFYEFLDGAHEMDKHFKEAEFSKNIPVLLGLLGIWYINFFGCQHQALVPYSHELMYFRDYIQQADMESNGKSVTRFNECVDYATGPVIVGEQGCDSQHSFFQHIHQGPHFTPIDFILVARGKYFQQQQDILIASALSQAQALMQGRSYSEEETAHWVQHKMIPGNRPSNVLFLKKITPHSLGMLIALYEHKIFVQGIVWNINSFDQWGVELGKQLLPGILADLDSSTIHPAQDSSTAGLIQYYRNAV